MTINRNIGSAEVVTDILTEDQVTSNVSQPCTAGDPPPSSLAAALTAALVNVQVSTKSENPTDLKNLADYHAARQAAMCSGSGVEVDTEEFDKPINHCYSTTVPSGESNQGALAEATEDTLRGMTPPTCTYHDLPEVVASPISLPVEELSPVDDIASDNALADDSTVPLQQNTATSHIYSELLEADLTERVIGGAPGQKAPTIQSAEDLGDATAAAASQNKPTIKPKKKPKPAKVAKPAPVAQPAPRPYQEKIYNPDGVTQVASNVLNVELAFALRTHKGYEFNPDFGKEPMETTAVDFRRVIQKLIDSDKLLPQSADSHYQFIGRFVQLFGLVRAAVIRSPACYNTFREMYNQAVLNDARPKIEAEIMQKIEEESKFNFATTGDAEYDEFLVDVVKFNWEFEKTDSRMEYALCIQRLNSLARRAYEKADQGNHMYRVTLYHYATASGVNLTTLLAGL